MNTRFHLGVLLLAANALTATAAHAGVAQSVPEPSSVALGLLGGAALLARRSRRKG